MSASGSGAEGRNRANGGVESVAKRRAAESQTEAPDLCRSVLDRLGRAGAEWSALATAGRGVGRPGGDKRNAAAVGPGGPLNEDEQIMSQTIPVAVATFTASSRDRIGDRIWSHVASMSMKSNLPPTSTRLAAGYGPARGPGLPRVLRRWSDWVL